MAVKTLTNKRIDHLPKFSPSTENLILADERRHKMLGYPERETPVTPFLPGKKKGEEAAQ